MISVLKDSLDRPLRNLRLSVTDRCNLRCSYCMPEAEYVGCRARTSCTSRKSRRWSMSSPAWRGQGPFDRR